MSDMRKTLISGSGSRVLGTAGLDASGEEPAVVVQHPWYQILLVRLGRSYFQTFSGLLAAQSFGVINVAAAVDSATNQQWSTFAALAYVSLLPTVVSLIQNVTEFLTKIDQSNPLFHA